MEVTRFKIESEKTLVCEIDFSQWGEALWPKTEEVIEFVRNTYGEDAVPKNCFISTDCREQIIRMYTIEHSVVKL